MHGLLKGESSIIIMEYLKSEYYEYNNSYINNSFTTSENVIKMRNLNAIYFDNNKYIGN